MHDLQLEVDESAIDVVPGHYIVVTVEVAPAGWVAITIPADVAEDMVARWLQPPTD